MKQSKSCLRVLAEVCLTVLLVCLVSNRLVGLPMSLESAAVVVLFSYLLVVKG